MTWEQWIAHHATLFCWRGDDDLRTLAAWAAAFARAGYGPAELAAASERLLPAPPRFKGDHWSALRALADAARRRDAGDDRAAWRECPSCGGNAVVALPVGAGGRLAGYWCDCVPPGHPARQGHPERLDFTNYRCAHPDWRERVRDWAERTATREPRLARALGAWAARLTEGR